MSEYKDRFKKVTHPKKYGPIWVLLHRKAFKAVTLENKIAFERYLYETVQELECKNCRDHALQYLKEHPIRQYFNVKDTKTGADIGIFKYLWIMHNDVNKRIGKKELDWMTALSMYGSNESCTDCSSDKKDDRSDKSDDREDNKKDKKKGEKFKVRIVGKYSH